MTSIRNDDSGYPKELGRVPHRSRLVKGEEGGCYRGQLWYVNFRGSVASRHVDDIWREIGIGFPTARELARAGATVWLACRNPVKAEEAVKQIQKDVPDADLKWLPFVDLTDLASVKAFADAVKKEWDRVDVLCLNAGIMAIPNRTLTKDGFEMQFQSNHLAHFALAAQLFELLMNAEAPRVVNVSSAASNFASKANFENLPDYKTGYGAWGAYGVSKLSNILFTHELQRRCDEKAGGKGKSKLLVASCHPGYSATELQRTGPQMTSGISGTLVGWANALFARMLISTCTVSELFR